jgi:hypothetical protein
MPNTLAHIAINSAVLAPLRVPFAAVLAGCIIPDVPWIVRRILIGTHFDLPQVETFAYFVVLASLFGCVAMCLAFSLLFKQWKLVFGFSVLGCLIHLLADSLQDKWGVGVHLFAPLTWQALSLASIPIESTATRFLTIAGLAIFFLNSKRFRIERDQLTVDSARLSAFTVCLIAYFSLPVVFVDDVIASNTQHLGTLMNRSDRSGKPIETDRSLLERAGVVWQTDTHTGETLIIANPDPSWTTGSYSLRGKFKNEREIIVSEWKAHTSFRDVASYVGLLLATGWFGALAVSRARKAAGTAPN